VFLYAHQDAHRRQERLDLWDLDKRKRLLVAERLINNLGERGILGEVDQLLSRVVRRGASVGIALVGKGEVGKDVATDEENAPGQIRG
jgi:hypothetical protein